MGGCSSQESKVRVPPPGPGARPGLASGLDSPRAGPYPTPPPNGEFDELLYHSLPPHEIAHEAKLLHPKYGGPNNGVYLLSLIFVAARNLRDHARRDPVFRFIDTDKLCGNARAMKIMLWFGFTEDHQQPGRLTAEDSPGFFALRRKENEFRVAFMYLEACIGGVPP